MKNNFDSGWQASTQMMSGIFDFAALIVGFVLPFALLIGGFIAVILFIILICFATEEAYKAIKGYYRRNEKKDKK